MNTEKMETMLIKSNSCGPFTLSLKMTLNYEMGYVDFMVALHNNANGRKQAKLFDANKFGEALQYYKQQETMFVLP